MPASKQIIAEQIKRFRNHRNFPDETGQRELAKAFDDCSNSNEHAIALADLLIRTQEFSPVPASVYKATELLAEQSRFASPAPPYTNGEPVFDGWLTDGMTFDDYERWQRLKDQGKTKHIRDIAAAIVTRYEQQKPGGRT